MFAVEDGFGGVVCTDGTVVTAQLVEHFGKTVRRWTRREDAVRDSKEIVGRPKVVVLDEMGWARV